MSVQSFIPTIWSARLTEHLDNNLVAKHFFNTDYEGEISEKGDTVKINQIGDISIFDYVKNQDIPDPEQLNTDAQTLLINQAKSFNFQVDDVDAAQMNTILMDKAMQRAGYGLASVEEAFLFKLIESKVVAANKLPAATATTADEAYRILLKLRTALTKANVPHQGRKAALPPEMVALLLEDPRFTATGSGDAENRLTNGLVGKAAGFNIYEVNTLTTVTTKSTIVAGHEMGGTFAQQIGKTEAYRPEKRFADAVKGLALYGAEILIPKAYATIQVDFKEPTTP